MVEGNRGVDGTRPLPRANGEQLAQNVGRKVRLVVKVRTPPPPPPPPPPHSSASRARLFLPAPPDRRW